MARPALVIGVGGAGGWVLTHLKKDLLETYQNKLPDEVKLLAFDTLRHPAALAGNDPNRDANQYGDKRQKKAGAVELTDRIEYIHIGADLNPLVNEITQGNMPHLNWVQTDNVLRTLPEGALQCDDGAAGIRQLGRLCLINDVNSNASKITSNIKNAITRITKAAHVDAAHRLEIIIVGSLAGGTGAGMLVDLPLLCKKLAGGYSGNTVLRGFIITPRAFTPGGFAAHADDMLASSFAAWRELDRWLITSDVYGGNRVEYSAINPNLNVQTVRRPYDITYMVDPNRLDHPLPPGTPEVGIYPALANVISAILDDLSGPVYSEDISLNISKTLSAHPSKPLHSAVGSFTIKEPVFYEQMRGAYQLAKDSLDIFLAPEKDPITGRIIRLKENENQEKPGVYGVDAANEFLGQAQVVVRGNPFLNTELEKRMVDIYLHNRNEDKVYISQIARSTLNEEEKAFKSCAIVLNPDHLDLLRREEYPLWWKIPPSIDRNRDPNSQSEKERVQGDVSKDRNQRFGNIDLRTNQADGEYGKKANELVRDHLEVFKNELIAYSAMNLSGISDDPKIARGGKLGWMIGFYGGLIKVMTYYYEFVQKVLDERDSKDLNKMDNAKASAERALNTFDRNPKKWSWLTTWDNNIHPESHRLQRAYLRAEQQVNQVRREEIILFKIQQTTLALCEFVTTSLKKLKEWEVYLAKGKSWQEIEQGTGNPIFHEIKGLYHAVEEELQNVDNNYQYSLGMTDIEDVLPPTFIGDEHPNYIDDLLRKMDWGVNINQDGSLGFEMHPIELRATGLEAGDRENLGTFTREAEQPYAQLLAKNPPLPVAQTVVIKHPSGATGNSLGHYLDHRAEPFYELRRGALGALHEPHPRRAFIRVNSAPNLIYISAMREQIEALDNTVSFEPIVPSQDNFKLTYLRFDDCIESQDFDIWNICKDAYLRFFNNPINQRKPRDFHTFPAELHACEYEEKIATTLRKTQYILHPKVVALLDNEQRVEMFFRALALEYIKRITNNNTQIWVFKTPDMTEEIWLTDPVTGYGIVDDEQEIWFNLMHQFVVKCCDIRSMYNQNLNYQIDWKKLETMINKAKWQVKEQKYNSQGNNDDGLVKVLRSYIREKRAHFPNQPAIQSRVAVAHEHLADLAETIYKIAIQEKK